MLVGRPPFEGASVAAVIAQRFTTPAPSVRVARRDVPEAADRALRRAMALEPAQRFPSIIDFVRALGVSAMVTPPGGVAAIEESVAPVAPATPTGPGPRARLALFGLALIVVAAVAVVAALKLLSRP
jgi:serine/threonine-protein kinase